MKKLNYFLCCFCLLGTAVSAAVWLKQGDGTWMALSGFLFLSGIIFFLFYLIEEKQEEINRLRVENFKYFKERIQISESVDRITSMLQ